MKKQPTGWEKIFLNHISDRELMSRVYKEKLQLNNKKPKLPNSKMGKELN